MTQFLLYICMALAGMFDNQSAKVVDSQPALPTGGHDFEQISDIPVPEGFNRIPVKEGSFAEYLRTFDLRPDQDTVFYYDGRPKWYQASKYAIVDIDIGKRDLQQCADVVMHFRADYLWRKKAYDDISFNFVSGKKANYRNYASGDYSMRKFQKYLVYVYSYANTSSLRKQMQVVEPKDMQIGDVFVQAGQPYGHAMIVVDMVQHPTTGKKKFMLAQGFIPAQDCEVVINPRDSKLSPWYSCDIGAELRTPQWIFYPEDLRRFHGE